jgi:acyl-CoA synthetase (AMP-forming)/AMP-acid ligase II
LSSRTPLDGATLVEHLMDRALAAPGAEAACMLGRDGEPAQRLTRGALDHDARVLAAALGRRCAPGERVLLLYPPGLEFVTAFLACLYAGVVAVPAPPPHLTRVRAALPRLGAMVADCAAALVLTTAAVRPALEAASAGVPELARIPWIGLDDLAGGTAEEWTGPAAGPDDLAFLQYTSGSTTTPRGVMVSHANLLANLTCIASRVGITGASRMLSWQPHFHDMGLVGGILSPLFAGASLVLMAPAAVLQSPLRWLRAVAQFRATHSGGPNFVFEQCAQRVSPEERAALDLSSWECAFCGAEPVQAATLRRFVAVFGPAGFRPRAFAPCYGLAEVTLMGSSVAKGQAAAVLEVSAAALEAGRAVPTAGGGRQLVSCGPVVDGHELAIVDSASGQVCSPGQVGEVWLSGPSVGRGYWNRGDESRDVFGARLPGGGARTFLRTGDLGFLHQGELYVAGRIKDVIVVAGRNHYPQDLEASVAESHAALRSAGVAAFPVDVDGSERVAVAVELDRTLARLLGRDPAAPPDPRLGELSGCVRQAVSEEHGLQVHEVVLLGPGGIPRTSSGKVRRRECRALFERRWTAQAALAASEE